MNSSNAEFLEALRSEVVPISVQSDLKKDYLDKNERDKRGEEDH